MRLPTNNLKTVFESIRKIWRRVYHVNLFTMQVQAATWELRNGNARLLTNELTVRRENNRLFGLPVT